MQMKLRAFFVLMGIVAAGCCVAAPRPARALNFFNLSVAVQENLKQKPEKALTVQGGEFTPAGWKVANKSDYIDFNMNTMCSGLVSFDVTGISQQSIEAPGRGTKDLGALFDMFDDSESGQSQDPAFFQGACYDAGLQIGGSEDAQLLPSGVASCTDAAFARGRSLVRTDLLQGQTVCVFDGSAYLRNDLIGRQDMGKMADYRSSLQSDGAPYDVGDRRANDAAGREPIWDAAKTYHFKVTWEKSSPALTITRTTTPSADDPNIINHAPTVDTFVVENKKGVFAPGLGRFRLGNTATLLASGTRQGDHAIPGAVFSNLTVVGNKCEPDFSACPSYNNASCVDSTLQEDRPLAQDFNPDHPPDPVSFSTHFAIGIPPLGVSAKFNLAPFVDAVKKVAQLPELIMKLVPQSPKPKEEVQALAQVSGYSVDAGAVNYTTWCVDGVFQGGANAGGQWATEVDSGDKDAALIGPCCRPILRTPAAGDDADGDGMADSWEMKYFHTTDVKADGNSDGDGCLVTAPRNEKGQPVTLAPRVEDSKGHSYILGKSGAFTNIMEYIFGTDPTDADTDSDGTDDECDILGLNQTSFKFTPSVARVGVQSVRATTVGMSLQYLTSIVSTEQKIYVGAGGTLDVRLSQDGGGAASSGSGALGGAGGASGVKPGDLVTVVASAAGGLNGAANLDFQWKMRKPVRDAATGKITGATTVDLCVDGAGKPTGLCGLGKNRLTTKLPGAGELNPREYVTIEVVVSEQATNRRTKQEVQVMADGGSVMEVGVARSDDATCASPAMNDQTPAVGQRVAARASLDAAGFASGAGAPQGSVTASWSIDGVKVQAGDPRLVTASGSGAAAGSAVGVQNLCFLALKSAGQSYDIGLTVVDEIGTRYPAASQQVVVSAPSVTLMTDPASPAPGGRVRVTAKSDNFSDDATLTYAWTVNGEPVEAVIGSAGDVIEYKADATRPSGHDTVHVDVRSSRDVSGASTTRMIDTAAPRSALQQGQRLVSGLVGSVARFVLGLFGKGG